MTVSMLMGFGMMLITSKPSIVLQCILNKSARSSCLKLWVYLNLMIFSAIVVSGNPLYSSLYM